MPLATNRDERLERYRAIEEYRGRPLIVYATSTRHGVNAMMAGDAVREFIDQINAIEKKADRVDVMIHSTGGDALAAWKLMSVLRERFKSVSVLVPNMAFSAATIFALGADEIVMHRFASLGPIDPQIQISLPDGKTRGFAYEDVGAFLRFLKDEARVDEQAHASTLVDKLLSVVDPVHVGGAKRASELSSQVGERLLLLHMEDKIEAKRIAEDLNKSFFAHGDAVSRTRATELKLKVAPLDDHLEQLMWDAYLALESYMQLREPFIPLHVVMADPTAAQALKPSAPLVLPANTPPAVVQQLWQQVAQQAIQGLGQAGVEVPYEIVVALIESRRMTQECSAKGFFSACRLVGGEIRINQAQTAAGWAKVG